MSAPVGLTTVATVLAGALFLNIVSYYVYVFVLKEKKRDAIPELPGIQFLHGWRFFGKRYDFMTRNFRKTGKKFWQFGVLQHKVVALSGEDGRKIFFHDRSMSFDEGYRLLMGGAPRVKDINVQNDDNDEIVAFNKRLNLISRRDRLAIVIPTLFSDVHKKMAGWGTEGKINPFSDVYKLVFQMMVRLATCDELAGNSEEVQLLLDLYTMVEKSGTAATTLLPWLPSSARKNKQKATMELFQTLYKYAYMRRMSNALGDDPIDLMLAEGDSNEEVVSYVMRIIFAGVVNTGKNTCWILMFLAGHPEWREKVAAELETLIGRHTNGDSSTPLHLLLSTIPIEAWENELPSLELVIRECIRLIFASATLLRRNVTGPVRLDEEHVMDRGAFATYLVADAHLNPEIYNDPLRFDPSRFEPGRQEDKKLSNGFLGWGTGRHPCTGMNMAKLQIKIVIALFLSSFDYELVDGSGKPPTPFPVPDRNNSMDLPSRGPCYLAFKRKTP